MRIRGRQGVDRSIGWRYRDGLSAEKPGAACAAEAHTTGISSERAGSCGEAEAAGYTASPAKADDYALGDTADVEQYPRDTEL
jgi:hypothetical protein